MRLERKLRREGHTWEPTDEYMRTLSSAVSAGCRLLRQIRALVAETRSEAAELGELELTAALREHLQRELRDMDDVRFLALLEERQARAGGDGEPS